MASLPASWSSATVQTLTNMRTTRAITSAKPRWALTPSPAPDRPTPPAGTAPSSPWPICSGHPALLRLQQRSGEPAAPDSPSARAPWPCSASSYRRRTSSVARDATGRWLAAGAARAVGGSRPSYSVGLRICPKELGVKWLCLLGMVEAYTDESLGNPRRTPSFNEQGCSLREPRFSSHPEDPQRCDYCQETERPQHDGSRSSLKLERESLELIDTCINNVLFTRKKEGRGFEERAQEFRAAPETLNMAS